MSIEHVTAAHYASGGILGRIIEALRTQGVDPGSATADDLKPIDEFHIGGVGATRDLLESLAITPDMQILDIGCGLGGTARLAAATTGAGVVGLDLTPEFVETAGALSRMVGMEDRTRFELGSALAMPFHDASFDVALLLHVGMNIPDKCGLMAEAARVLKAGGRFAVYDVMATSDEPLDFPVPWASVPENSFVGSLGDYRAAAAAAGFVEVGNRGRRDAALRYFAEQRARLESKGPPALGIHLLMGETRVEKIRNMVANITAGRIAPTELLLRLP